MPWKRSDAGPCECEWFEQAAAEPHVPVQFDARLGEYDLVYEGPDGPSRLRLYFCPLCGGAAPISRREEMFARLTEAELHRLHELTDHLKTVEDVVGRFGPPDADHPFGYGERSPAAPGAPPIERRFRTLVYNRLSDSVEVRAIERSNGEVRFAFAGKQLPPPFYRYLPDADVHVVDCSGTVNLQEGIARFHALELEFRSHPLRDGRRRMLIDFRNTVWESEEVHQQLSVITRRDFGLNADNASLRAAIVNNRWQGSISDNEHWFLTESEALEWLCLV